MTHEEYLKQKPKHTREEIRAINAEYLGAYLFGILKPGELNFTQTKISVDGSKELSMHQYESHVEKLYKTGCIDDAEMLLLLDLVNIPLVPNSKSDTKAKVREILGTTKPDWLGEV